MEDIYLNGHWTLLLSHNDIYKLTEWSCYPRQAGLWNEVGMREKKLPLRNCSASNLLHDLGKSTSLSETYL